MPSCGILQDKARIYPWLYPTIKIGLLSESIGTQIWGQFSCYQLRFLITQFMLRKAKLKFRCVLVLFAVFFLGKCALKTTQS
jgi:hypothetical protein